MKPKENKSLLVNYEECLLSECGISRRDDLGHIPIIPFLWS